MVNWLIVAVILAVLFVALFIVSVKVLEDMCNWAVEVGAALSTAFCGAAALVILLLALVYTMDYKNFETSFEIQRQTVAELAANGEINSDNLLYMADIVEANKELAEKQASKRNWKDWSMYPDRVLDIKPIGLD